MKYLPAIALSSTILLTSCSGGGGASPPSSNFVISGTVPGTIIEAYGDNGSYYQVSSNNNGTGMHPFTLSLKAGVNYSLFMTVNENTPEAITTPIYFNNNGTPTASFSAPMNQTINFGHLPLYTTKTDAINGGDDMNNDGVLDDGKYYMVTIADIILDATTGTKTWDIDGDGKHNYYDDDYTRGSRVGDTDDDGIADSIDINPNNTPNSNRFSNSYYDLDDDGYFDNDRDRDGYLDDEYDYDDDGYYDEDDHYHHYGDNNGYGEVEGKITAIDGHLITIYAYEIEGLNISNKDVVIDTSNAYFEHTSLELLTINQLIEAKGSWDSVNNLLNAFKVERED